jgi:hypothetical protein
MTQRCGPPVWKKADIEVKCYVEHRITAYAFAATKLDGSVSTHNNNFLRSAAQVSVSPAVETGCADGIAEQYLHAQVRSES